ncbi:MAG: DNA gyrase subunit A [Patescibacteria group bacterium]
MDIGRVQEREIIEEMRESYLDYAMSVIVARALPDVRDGLKPVHRRILFTMHEMGLTHAAKFRKCAAIVGDCLGKYHPHGDAAVYETLVRMAQDFAMRHPLVDGQGNFGSIDGDNAAAPRYTESRMTRIAEDLLKDIEKDTVDFRPNYDNTRDEPVVLPAAFPNLLVNGTVGIAVGMATNIPPHNLGETMAALVHLAGHPDATVEDLMAFVKGPDFPTAGSIFDTRAIREAYATGKGAILMRGTVDMEEGPRGSQIIITEIPYQVNKAELIVTMATLVQDKRIEGIRDIRDESDRDGMRIAIDLKSDAHPQKVLNNLYKRTDLEKNFNLNLLALVDGLQPQVLSLKDVLAQFLAHRTNVVTRRTRFDLTRTEERIHILEGLKKALDHIDRVIQTIKQSEDRERAHANLMKKFDLSDRQAAAILDMRLATLAGLERQKIEDELKEKMALARQLAALLKDPKRMLEAINQEFAEISARFSDPRRTKVVARAPGKLADEDLIPNEEVVIMLTRGGYIKRIKPENYRMQKRGGKGLIGIETKEEDVVEHLLLADTHADILFFTDAGKVYQVRAYDIPEGSRIAKGKTVAMILSVGPTEKVTSILAVPRGAKAKKNAPERDVKKYIVMLTDYGTIKKVEAGEFEAVRRNGLIALTLKKDDRLRWARLTGGGDELILVTSLGNAIRFSERDVRPMGRNAAGVTALRLKSGDTIVGMDVIDNPLVKTKGSLLVVMEHGFGKHTPVSNFKKQRRGGSGIKAANVTDKTGKVIGARIVREEEMELIAISRKGQVIRTELGSIPSLGRVTQGVRIMRAEVGDAVASMTTL